MINQKINQKIISNIRRSVLSEVDLEIKKSIEFLKTEKELWGSLDNYVKSCSDRIAILKSDLKTLRTKIGVEPNRKVSSYDYDGEPENAEDLYAYNYNQVSEVPAAADLPTPDENDPKQLMMEQYNSKVYSIRDLYDKIDRLKTIRDNLDKGSNKKHKIGEYELKKYGF